MDDLDAPTQTNFDISLCSLWWDEKHRGGVPPRTGLVSQGVFSALITSKYVALRCLASSSPASLVAMSPWGEAGASYPHDPDAPPASDKLQEASGDQWRSLPARVTASAWSSPVIAVAGAHCYAPLLAYAIEQSTTPTYASIVLACPEESQADLLRLPLAESPRALAWIPPAVASSVVSPSWSIVGRVDPVLRPLQFLFMTMSDRVELWALTRAPFSPGVPHFKYSVTKVAESPNDANFGAIQSVHVLPREAHIVFGSSRGYSAYSSISLTHDAAGMVQLGFSLRPVVQPSSRSARAAALVLSVFWRQQIFVASCRSSELCLVSLARDGVQTVLLSHDFATPGGGVIMDLCWFETRQLCLYVAVGEGVACVSIDSNLRTSLRHSVMPYPREDVPIRPGEPIVGLQVSPNGLLLSTLHRRDVNVEERSAVLLKMVNSIQYVRRLGDQSVRDALDLMVRKHEQPKCYWDLFALLVRLCARDPTIPLRLVKYVRTKFVSAPSAPARCREEALKVCNALYSFLLKHQPQTAEDKASYTKIVANNRLLIRELRATRLVPSIEALVRSKTLSGAQRSAAWNYLSVVEQSVLTASLIGALGQVSDTHPCSFCDAPVSRLAHERLLGTCDRGHSTTYCCFTYQPLGSTTAPRIRCSYCLVSGFDLRYSPEGWEWLTADTEHTLCPFCGELCR